MISARIVTADGEVLTISETENAELFWGVRGAGFNFGIVTSATYKLHKLADNNNGEILTADFIIPANKTLFYFDWLESLGETMPPNAAGVSRFQFDSIAKEVMQNLSLSSVIYSLTIVKGPNRSKLGIHWPRRRGSRIPKPHPRSPTLCRHALICAVEQANRDGWWRTGRHALRGKSTPEFVHRSDAQIHGLDFTRDI